MGQRTMKRKRRMGFPKKLAEVDHSAGGAHCHEDLGPAWESVVRLAGPWHPSHLRQPRSFPADMDLQKGHPATCSEWAASSRTHIQRLGGPHLLFQMPVESHYSWLGQVLP